MGQDKFSQRLLHWFDRHGRHELPWQTEQTPYRVWVSEIMLQQTQVTTVIPYYQRFMQRFPDVSTLAQRSQDDVLQYWAGLGYYARGRNLHHAAQLIVDKYKGIFPDDIEDVVALPGIGRSTAGAILALSRNQRHAILDGNVKRCLSRYHGISGYPGTRKVETELWAVAERHTPTQRVKDYTQAIMDFGATLCTRSKPHCAACPQNQDCYAFKHDQVAFFPHARPKRKNPVKHRYMLAMLDENANVALFKRPQKGIWGGLYSLPEYDSREGCSEQLADYQLETIHLREGERIQHVFSHFTLHITPLFVTLSNEGLTTVLSHPPETNNSPDIGVMLHQPSLYRVSSETVESNPGVPAPVRRILDEQIS